MPINNQIITYFEEHDIAETNDGFCVDEGLTRTQAFTRLCGLLRDLKSLNVRAESGMLTEDPCRYGVKTNIGWFYVDKVEL